MKEIEAERIRGDTVYRQQAIDEINKYWMDLSLRHKKISKGEFAVFFDCREIIEQLPPAQPEPICVAKVTLTDEQVKEAVEKAKCEILTVLSAEPERKVGQWTDNNACPFCGCLPWFERDIHTLSFCPNCGADLRGKKNDS